LQENNATHGITTVALLKQLLFHCFKCIHP